jgi:hypothetical protein
MSIGLRALIGPGALIGLRVVVAPVTVVSSCAGLESDVVERCAPDNAERCRVVPGVRDTGTLEL